MRDLIFAILETFGNFLFGYLDLISARPFDFWIGVAIVGVVMYIMWLLLDRSFTRISARINAHPGNETLYKSLWRYRDAREPLSQAMEELEYHEGYYRTIMIGKVPSIQWVPPVYPDPAYAKTYLQEAIDLIDGKRIDLKDIRRIREYLPNLVELTGYQGKGVDNNTFSRERAEIFAVLAIVKMEIEELEFKLPAELIIPEKRILMIREGVSWMAAIVGGCAFITFVLQAIMFGLALLMQ